LNIPNDVILLRARRTPEICNNHGSRKRKLINLTTVEAAWVISSWPQIIYNL